MTNSHRTLLWRLAPWINVSHRGKVDISKNRTVHELITLQGCLFEDNLEKGTKFGALVHSKFHISPLGDRVMVSNTESDF